MPFCESGREKDWVEGFGGIAYSGEAVRRGFELGEVGRGGGEKGVHEAVPHLPIFVNHESCVVS